MKKIKLPRVEGETSTRLGDVFSVRCNEGGDDDFFLHVLKELMKLNSVKEIVPKISTFYNREKCAIVYTAKSYAQYPDVKMLFSEYAKPVID